MNIKISTTTKMPKKKQSKPSCNICCETYTKSARAIIKCGHCDFEACKQCVRSYLLSTSDLYHCMSCKNPWDLGFSRKALNSAFIDGSYKTHRKQLLFDIEKARLPETMPYVEKYLSIETIRQENIKLKDEMDDILKIYQKKRQQEQRNKNRMEAYSRGNYAYTGHGEEKKEHKIFIKGCPVDDCRGFLSSQWKCGVCKIHVCNKCLEPIGDDKNMHHECNEDSVKTAAMLKKDTKNCPSCAASIFKVSGCDQMWCTQCHIAFSWKSGLKVNGVIHNPHFYQWQKNNGGNTQNPEAVHCGGIPDYYYFRNKVRAIIERIGPDMVNKLMRFHRATNHFVHVELTTLRGKIQQHTDNTDLRVKYLAKEMDEEDIKRKLASRDISKLKTRAILDIYELFNTVITECMVIIYNITNDADLIDIIKREMDKITNVRCYCNKQLRNVGYIYRQMVKLINPSLYTESERFRSNDTDFAKKYDQERDKKYFSMSYKWSYNDNKLAMIPIEQQQGETKSV